VDLVDPFGGKVHQLPRVVLAGEYLRLKPADLASRGGLFLWLACPTAHHMPHGRVKTLIDGVIDRPEKQIYVECMVLEITSAG